MATASVSRSYHGTLVGNTTDTITFTNPSVKAIEVKNRGSSGGDIYFRTDGDPAAVGGTNTYIVLPGEALTVPFATPHGSSDSISLISTGTPAYSLTVVPG